MARRGQHFENSFLGVIYDPKHHVKENDSTYQKYGYLVEIGLAPAIVGQETIRWNVIKYHGIGNPNVHKVPLQVSKL